MAVNFSDVTKSGLRGCGSSTSMISLIVPGRAEKTATRSARNVASPRLWVTNTMVLSVRESSTERSSPRIMRVCSSSAPNGSSISRMPVSRLSARASGARHALENHAEVDVLEHGVPGEQRVFLEHEGDVARHRAGHPLAGHFHGAGGRVEQTADHVEQGRLAATARTDQADELA